MIAISTSRYYASRRRSLGYLRSGLGDATACPSADISTQLKKVQYCQQAGVGLVPCAGQDLPGIQAYNMQLQTDANNALNQCNCNNAWVLNGRVGQNNCASMYPVSGKTAVAQPVAPTRTTTVTYVGNQYVASTPNSTQRSTASQGGSTQTGTSTSSTNANSQADTTSAGAILGIPGLQIIIGVIGVGLALLAMNNK